MVLYYFAIPNSLSMNLACPAISDFPTHLTLPLRIMCTASIPCKVRQALRNQP